jgi:hypothetical protein
MTERTIVICFSTIMALETNRHFRQVSFAGLLTCRNTDMASFTLGPDCNMFLMVEQNRSFRVGEFFRFVRIAVTLKAHFIIVEIMT